MAKTSKIVYVTQAQYDSLINDGSVTIYGVTYTYDANNTYLVREEGLEGTSVKSTGETSGKVLTADGSGGAAWAAAGGGSGDVTASGTLSVGAVMVGLGGKTITSLNGSNGKILGWSGGATWQDPPKLYVHYLKIWLKDGENHTYQIQDRVYSTQSTNLVTDVNSFVEYIKKYADRAESGDGMETYQKVFINNDTRVKNQIYVMKQGEIEQTLLKEYRTTVSSTTLIWSNQNSGTLTSIDSYQEYISEV